MAKMSSRVTPNVKETKPSPEDVNLPQNKVSPSPHKCSPQGDNPARLEHPTVPEVLGQEVTLDTNQGSSIQNSEILTKPEGSNIMSEPDRKSLEKDWKLPKVFEKIMQYPKQFGETFLKEFEKKIIALILTPLLAMVSVFFPCLSGSTMTSATPVAQQGQTQVINIMYCPASVSASPVAVTPHQPTSKADNNQVQVYQACNVVQQ